MPRFMWLIKIRSYKLQVRPKICRLESLQHTVECTVLGHSLNLNSWAPLLECKITLFCMLRISLAAARLTRLPRPIKSRALSVRTLQAYTNMNAPSKLPALDSSAGPLVWIDCEMTGLNPRTDKILEIAVCSVPSILCVSLYTCVSRS